MSSGTRPRSALKPVLLVVLVAAAFLALAPLLLFLVFLLFVRPLKKAERHLAGPPYLGGAADVSPDRVVAGGDPVPLGVSYRVGPEGIARGGAIRLCPGKVLRFGPSRWRLCFQWGNGWGCLQGRHPDRPNFVDVTATRDDVELRVSLMERALPRTQRSWLKRKFLQKAGLRLEPIDPKDAFLENQKVTVEVAQGRLEEGDTVEFNLGSGAGMEVPYSALETDFAIEVDPNGDGNFRLVASVPSVRVTGGRPAGLEVMAPTTAAPGELIRVLVRCLDSRGVLTPEFSGRLMVSSSREIDSPAGVVIPDGGEGVAWFQAAVTGRGIARIRVTDSEGGLEGESNPVVCANSAYRLLWGDIHTHSLVSDGTQEPGYQYHRARDLLGWDFTAVTDHDIWSLGEEHPRAQEEFALMVRAAEENHRPGEFITFPAFEWTEHRLGHRNVIFGPGEEPVFLPHTDPGYATPELLFEALSGRNVTVIPHHPAWKTHFGEMRYDFGPPGNPIQRLVEVYSRHGNSEFYGCPRPMTHLELIEGRKGKLIRAIMQEESAGEDSGSYVRDALAAGHRLGLIAGSDEHLVGTDPRKGFGLVYGGGITGIYSTSATREGAWLALWNRRVCGTTGGRIFMELRVNGQPQGSELHADSPPRVTGHVVGTADIDTVELVKFDGNGYSTPWQGGGKGPEAVIDFTDTGFSGDSFYYLRVLQADGHMGWVGPTWVDRAP